MTTIVFSLPDSIDLQALADTTKQTVELLKQSALQTPSRNDFVVAQASKYVEAIKLTISAAYSGFTVTEDILCLAEALDAGAEDKADIEHYVVGMLALASESRESSTKALDAFRQMRRDLIELQNKIPINSNQRDHRKSGSTPDNEKGRPKHADLDAEINTIAQLIENVSNFASWWDWVKVETDAVAEGHSIDFQLDALRDKATVRKWKELKVKYASYVKMIGELEDANPLLFERDWKKDRPKPTSYITSNINDVLSATQSRPSAPATPSATIEGLGGNTLAPNLSESGMKQSEGDSNDGTQLEGTANAKKAKRHVVRSILRKLKEAGFKFIKRKTKK